MFNKVPNQWSDAMVIRNRSNKLADHAFDAHEHKASVKPNRSLEFRPTSTN